MARGMLELFANSDRKFIDFAEKNPVTCHLAIANDDVVLSYRFRGDSE